MASNVTDGYTAPYAGLSPSDQGGALLIVAIAGFLIALFSIGTRIHLAHRETERGFGFTMYRDDLLCFVSMFFCIIEFALIWASVKKGNGKDIDLISPQHLVKIQQIQYAVDIFYIISLYFSRASVLLLFQRLQSANRNILWHIALGVLTAWAIACIFAIALKCDLSHPWIEYNVQCTGLLSRWQSIEITGIVLEAAIFGLGGYLAYIVQMPLASKFQMIGLFTTRAMVVIFAGLRIAHLSSWFNSSNPTNMGIAAQIFGIAELYASLVTATTPLLKSFFFKFRVLAAKPTVVNVQPPYNTIADSTLIRSMETDPSRNKTKESDKGRRRAGKKRVQETSMAEYEQWMPTDADVKRQDSHCGDTDVTAKTDDDRSDRTLNREKERNKEMEPENPDVIKSVDK